MLMIRFMLKFVLWLKGKIDYYIIVTCEKYIGYYNN